MSTKWPNIFSAYIDIQNQFINVCTQQYLEAGIKIGLDRDFPTTTTLYKNANYAIWNGGPSVLQSAWNDHQIVHETKIKLNDLKNALNTIWR